MNCWKSWAYLPNMIFRGVLWKKFESKVTYAENTNMLKYCTCVRKNIFSEKPMNYSAALWSSYWVLGQNHQKKIERFKNASLAGSMSATLSQKRKKNKHETKTSTTRKLIKSSVCQPSRAGGLEKVALPPFSESVVATGSHWD